MCELLDFWIFGFCERQSVQGLRKSVQGLRKSVQGSRKSVQGSRKSMQGSRKSVQGSRKSVQGSQKSVQGLRKSVQGSRKSVQGVRANSRTCCSKKYVVDSKTLMESSNKDNMFESSNITACPLRTYVRIWGFANF